MKECNWSQSYLDSARSSEVRYLKLFFFSFSYISIIKTNQKPHLGLFLQEHV